MAQTDPITSVWMIGLMREVQFNYSNIVKRENSRTLNCNVDRSCPYYSASIRIPPAISHSAYIVGSLITTLTRHQQYCTVTTYILLSCWFPRVYPHPIHTSTSTPHCGSTVDGPCFCIRCIKWLQLKTAKTGYTDADVTMVQG
ncbi:hypothetical protein FVEG_14822 [Fusarium verticillioides 7600]|uniref:Uncharacterized protein n=1 Tax=Gibberella moniliformis (strain M3125 / FGSC 7600) TaxID=334819 RepID=W7LR51_GIBM7|nr:hypothetical protein FVEG_14822 [Fusarium verticillioides 7600]EWG37999.1 hypothetical protein FVEG_14822 [Fusarium verticillioides 7600]